MQSDPVAALHAVTQCGHEAEANATRHMAKSSFIISSEAEAAALSQRQRSKEVDPAFTRGSKLFDF